MKRLLLIAGLVLAMTGVASAQDTEATNSVDAYIQGRLVVQGMSAPNDTKFAAEHAARADAQAKMLSRIEGVYLRSEGLFRKGETAALVTTTKVQGHLRGARQCYRTSTKYEQVQVNGQLKYIATYCLEIPMRGRNSVSSIVYPALQEMSEELRVDNKPAFKPEPAVIKKEVKKEKPAYDGIIVDVRELRFYPDMVNRILTDGNQVLFGPSVVSEKWLVDRGCGAYYDNEDRARAHLKRWGSTNPLVVQGMDVSGNSDVVIDTEQASAVAASDAKEHFLSSARVVFLLR